MPRRDRTRSPASRQLSSKGRTSCVQADRSSTLDSRCWMKVANEACRVAGYDHAVGDRSRNDSAHSHVGAAAHVGHENGTLANPCMRPHLNSSYPCEIAW